MRIKTLEVAGIGPAIHALRNPFESYSKSDTHHGHIGPKDKELSEKLANAGPEHAKHMRMCVVWAEIWAPRYWWVEAVTYRHGVEMLSCSTMHRLMSQPFALCDFEMDRWTIEDDSYKPVEMIEYLNRMRDKYLAENDPEMKQIIWRHIIQNLPQSYIQRRTVMMSYQALRAMYRQRAGHKLREWQEFRDWCKTLPESWMITGEGQHDAE